MNDLKQEFESAYTKHILFKSKVKSFIYGSDTPLPPILDHRECQFGKWLQSSGLPKFGNVPEMRELDELHRQIHGYATTLVQLKQAGQDEVAIAGIAHLEQLASQVVSLLDTIKNKAMSK